jgi:hypothetical protein
VLNLTTSPWQDGTTSYYHKSIGGYHGVKLRRYQDLIDGYLSPGLQEIFGVLSNNPTQARVDSVLAAQQVLNMINTKYFILNPNGAPLQNRYAMGHGWLVNNYQLVENADQEFLALGNTDLRRTAVVDQRFEELLGEELSHEEVSGSVLLTSYQPNKMVYEVSAGQKSLVVFSEVYYGEHWKASIDGEAVDHLRANYILRALPVDAGEHSVEFEFVFEPYEKGNKVAMTGSIIIWLLLLGSLGYAVRNQFFRENTDE